MVSSPPQREDPQDKQAAIRMGQKIEAARQASGMTLDEVAEKLGTSSATISQYEKGFRRPSLERLGQLARALRTHPSRLVG